MSNFGHFFHLFFVFQPNGTKSLTYCCPSWYPRSQTRSRPPSQSHFCRALPTKPQQHSVRMPTRQKITAPPTKQTALLHFKQSSPTPKPIHKKRQFSQLLNRLNLPLLCQQENKCAIHQHADNLLTPSFYSLFTPRKPKHHAVGLLGRLARVPAWTHEHLAVAFATSPPPCWSGLACPQPGCTLSRDELFPGRVCPQPY